MKTNILFAGLAALVLLPACNKTLSEAEAPSEPISLVVDVCGDGTRATNVVSNSATGESKVNSLQVFVFKDGRLDGYGNSSTTSATVSCTAGSREIYAVVNVASLSSVTTKTELLAQVTNLTADGSNFAMIGSTTATLKQNSAVPINVERLAARVVIKGIKNSLTNSTLAADFKIKAIYLTNVAGDVDLGLTSSYTATRWFNKRGYQASNNLSSFTYDAINATVAAGESFTTPHYFYAMPNAKAAAEGGVWSPRATKLVIRCSLNGVTYDYPIVLPALQNNHSYEIELVTITRPGNLDDGNEPDDNHPDDVDEEKPVVGFDQNFSITVKNWTVVNITDGTTI